MDTWIIPEKSADLTEGGENEAVEIHNYKYPVITLKKNLDYETTTDYSLNLTVENNLYSKAKIYMKVIIYHDLIYSSVPNLRGTSGQFSLKFSRKKKYSSR